MVTKETISRLEYGKPPWVFKGSALYQLHLVKAETARAFIPKEFKLVEAFGYTLGGFFLANYEDSPAGIFDEKVTAFPGTKKGGFDRFLSKISMKDAPSISKNSIEIQVNEMNNHMAINMCCINLSAAVTAQPQDDSKKWMGPAIKISLPSFSGRTEYNPHLLKYCCQIECRVKAVSAARVSGPGPCTFDEDKDTDGDYQRNLCVAVMLSKPILALEFNSLKMKVEAPTVVSQ